MPYSSAEFRLSQPMKKFTLIILFIVCKVGLAQSYEIYNNDTINYIDVNGKRQGAWIITGKMKKDPAYKPDQKVEEGSYVDSKKTGIWKEYYPNNQMKSQINFVNNRPDGKCIMYHENGKVQEEGTWKGNRWSGEYKLYYENGNVRQAFNFNDMGQRVNKQTYYYEDGKVMIEGNWKDGKEDGMVTEYNADGSKKAEKFYNGGSIDLTKSKDYTTTTASTNTPKEDQPPKEESKTITKDQYKDANPKKPFNGTGQHTLLNSDKQVAMKGEFVNYKLKEGEQRIYENGILTRVKLFKEFVYVGDGPLPDEGNGKKKP